MRQSWLYTAIGEYDRQRVTQRKQAQQSDEPLIVEIICDRIYLRDDPERAYGWQVKNFAGDLLGYHYHAAATFEAASQLARESFGPQHPYNVLEV